MTIARRKQICLEVTPFYHCVTRCVRRSFLCGKDKFSGRNFNHRRGWIEKRLLLLSEVFCIEIAGYAIMSNHYHAVLKVNKEAADALSDQQVVDRWLRLYNGNELAKRFQSGEALAEHEQQTLTNTIGIWRENLSNLSRFMGNLNEHIARRANKEDDCRGHFWESRFKIQALLDLPALLRTLCYVDLNPMRAKMAETPESSSHTSVRRRLRHTTTGLMNFAPNVCRDQEPLSTQVTEHCIPVDFKDYLELLDWTGRQLKEGKRGVIDPASPPIMTRLGYTPQKWMKTQRPQLSWVQKALGSVECIKDYCDAVGQRWIWQNG